jgi:hypothetical protein
MHVLQIGNGDFDPKNNPSGQPPGYGLQAAQVHMSLWSIMKGKGEPQNNALIFTIDSSLARAAPLIMGNDPRVMDAQTLSVYLGGPANLAIKINQDPWGLQVPHIRKSLMKA